MTDLFEDLPDNVRKRISDNPNHREWRHCANCHIYHGKSIKLRICSGCVGTGSGAIYYCEQRYRCQSEHWPYHRKACLGRLARTNKATRILSRWLLIHYKILVWCLEQIYHYNAAADPCNTFICFHINGDTMELYRVCIQSKKGHYLFPNFDSNPTPPTTQHYLVELDKCSIHEGTWELSTFHSEVLARPQLRKKIPGYPNWLYIAATVVSSPQLSLSAANRKLIFLREAIRRHTAKGTLKLEKKFLTPLLTGCIELPTSDMSSWYANFNTFDLWQPFRESERLVTAMLDECCPLTHEGDEH
ncbi:hypothetical protein M408DRAFT_9682 [Serendipita vermifera MAFF 305830]|uniref:MYND-type domain-containing protein n=1 Tax=Serendipita vermifera MAFF 305830 TaxID=933852 RepID=A0A0C2WKH9_SERVB|nr:hypothetical protein M408DRAFT_9682 [Serendipita vermifera MAFF 305830]